MRDFQDFNLFSAFYPDNSNTNSVMLMASDLGLGLEPLADLQALGLSNAFATQNSHPVTPNGSSDSSESLGGKSCMQNYQDLSNSLPALCADSSHSNTQIKTGPRIGLEPLAGLQALGLNTPSFATQASQPGTPTACGSDTESMADGRTSRSCSATATSETHRKVRLSILY